MNNAVEAFDEVRERIDEISFNDEGLKQVFLSLIPKYQAFFAKHPNINLDFEELFNKYLYNDLEIKLVNEFSSSGLELAGGVYYRDKNQIEIKGEDISKILDGTLCHEFLHFITTKSKVAPVESWLDELLTDSVTDEIMGYHYYDHGYKELKSVRWWMDKEFGELPLESYFNGDAKKYYSERDIFDEDIQKSFFKLERREGGDCYKDIATRLIKEKFNMLIDSNKHDFESILNCVCAAETSLPFMFRNDEAITQVYIKGIVKYCQSKNLDFYASNEDLLNLNKAINSLRDNAFLKSQDGVKQGFVIEHKGNKSYVIIDEDNDVYYFMRGKSCIKVELKCGRRIIVDSTNESISESTIRDKTSNPYLIIDGIRYTYDSRTQSLKKVTEGRDDCIVREIKVVKDNKDIYKKIGTIINNSISDSTYRAELNKLMFHGAVATEGTKELDCIAEDLNDIIKDLHSAVVIEKPYVIATGTDSSTQAYVQEMLDKSKNSFGRLYPNKFRASDFKDLMYTLKLKDFEQTMLSLQVPGDKLIPVVNIMPLDNGFQVAIRYNRIWDYLSKETQQKIADRNFTYSKDYLHPSESSEIPTDKTGNKQQEQSEK